MKNHPPNVFVSSTMYDLSELRAQLGQFIERLGWHPVMSEYDSFPIDPDQTTVENCRRNVRENADVFVMVVGARYGSVDAEADRSVTNLEFLEAKARGVPTYVFVSRDILAQSRVWKANPESDFSGIVDTPRIFEFIESFRDGGGVWTYPFDSAKDIVSTLGNQFAYLVQDALELRQMAQGKDELLGELEGRALTLALRRDDYWEVKLFGTVLEEELDRRATFRREIEHGLASDDVTYIDLVEIVPWSLDRIRECKRFAATASTILNEYLPQALGEEGEPGNPTELAEVARRLAQLWEDCARFTLRCRAVRVDDRAERLVDLLSTVNANMLEEIWEYGHALLPRLKAAIEAAAVGGPTEVSLTLALTADVDELNEEIERFTEEMELLLGI